jgi:hypothetical protein
VCLSVVVLEIFEHYGDALFRRLHLANAQRIKDVELDFGARSDHIVQLLTDNK